MPRPSPHPSFGYPDNIWWNACYHAVHNILYSRLLTVDLYVCETWFLAEKEKYRLRVFGSRGSSGSIVSDYGLDDRGSIPDRGRGFLF
jgi:hypothetical protein